MAKIQMVIDWVNSGLEDSWFSFLIGFAGWFVWPLAIFVVALFVFYFFAILANWIAAPFNGPLAEAVEAHLTGSQNPASWSQVITDLPRVLGRELKKLVYYLPRALLFLLAWFVPVVGPILWFLFCAWMMAIQYIDFSMDNHKVPFTEAIRLLKKHRAQSMGLGSAVMILTMIPVINIVVMPAAVAGGTALWVDRFRDTHKHY